MVDDTVHVNVVLSTTIERKIVETTHEIERLQIKLSFLVEMREAAIPWGMSDEQTEEPKDQTEAAKPDQSENGLLGPREAVIRLLRESPSLKSGEIIARLNGNIRTNSTNLKRTIYSTINSLKSDGEIVRVKGGRYRVKQEK